MVKLKIIAILLMLSIIFGCTANDDTSKQATDMTEDKDTLGEVTGNTVKNVEQQTVVVARVDGTKITSDEVKAMQQVFMQQGQQVSREVALEQAINQVILENAIEAKAYMISDEEAEEAIVAQLELQGITLEDYKAMLETNGFPYEQELERIKSQLRTQMFVEEMIPAEDIEVTEEEAMALYEEYSAQTENPESFEDVSQQIVRSLEQQKRTRSLSIIINDLRSDADIEYVE